MIHSCISVVFMALFFTLMHTEKVPSAANIEEYDDPMLDEIFADTNSDRAVAAAPLPAANSQSQQVVAQHLEKLHSPPPVASAAKNVIDPNAKPAPGSVFSNPVNNNFQGVISPFNEAKNAFTPPPLGLDSSGTEFARPLTDLAFQAGHTFYSGFRQASRLFGLDAGQYQPYEVPLISQGARFFGRRRRK